jgi:hypothetical protein
MSCVDSAIPLVVEFPQADAGFRAGMIAVRAADVICPGGAARREVNRSMVQTLVTATTSPAVLAALAEAASRAALGTLIVTGRQRHSGRRHKSRPGFPHTQVTTPTVTGPVTITRFQPEWARPQAPGIP